MMKLLFENKKNILSTFLTILTVFCTYISGYADITPVQDRTPQIRDAIVAAVPGVNSANDVTRSPPRSHYNLGGFQEVNQCLESWRFRWSHRADNARSVSKCHQ